MTDVRARLEEAFRLHREGRLEEAARAYDRLLAEHPDHADTNHLAGILALQRGDLDRALERLGKAVARRPRVAPYRSSLGSALQAAGRLQQAVAELRRATELDPDLADAHFNLGNALAAGGELERSLASFRKAVRLNPGLVQAHNNLGNALAELGRHEEAVRSYRRALEAEPRYLDARLNLAASLAALGRSGEAEEEYGRVAAAGNPGASALAHMGRGDLRRALGDLEGAAQAYRDAGEAMPDLADARVNLAGALAELGELEEAEALLRELLETDADNVPVLGNLGHVLNEQGRHAEAREILEQALARAPQDPRVLNNLGRALGELGEAQAAIDAYRQALEAAPDFAEAHHNLGLVHLMRGYGEEAREAFEAAIAADPGYAGAHRLLASVRRYEPGDPHLAAMEALAGEPLEETARSELEFALGKAYSDLGDLDAAFSHYAQGNRIEREALDYDVREDLELFERIRETCTPALLEQAPPVSPAPEPPLPLPVVGLPRSGATLIERLLASHSQVASAGEADLLRPMIAPELAGLPVDELAPVYPEKMEGVGTEELAGLAARYREGLLAAARSMTGDPASGLPPARFLTDRTPGNALFLGALRMAFGATPVVYVRRDPRDVALSCYRTLFAGYQPHTFDLADLGAYIAAWERLMEHWQELLGEQIRTIDYETLVQAPERVTAELLEWLGLPVEPVWETFHTARGDLVRTASALEVRRPVHGEAAGRWQAWGSRLEPFLEAYRAHGGALPG